MKNKNILEFGSIVLATHNEGKLSELKFMFKPFGISLKSSREFGLSEPPETGKTFHENAFIKAFSTAQALEVPALADDSGLCVDALGGQPGVLTANWSFTKEGKRDFNLAMEKVERALKEVGAVLPEQRGARFVTVLCLAFPDGEADFFSGEIQGTLVWPPRGDLGFGYDPVFLPKGYDETLGQMTMEYKNTMDFGIDAPFSHRARAFSHFAEAYLVQKK